MASSEIIAQKTIQLVVLILSIFSKYLILYLSIKDGLFSEPGKGQREPGLLSRLGVEKLKFWVFQCFCTRNFNEAFWKYRKRWKNISQKLQQKTYLTTKKTFGKTYNIIPKLVVITFWWRKRSFWNITLLFVCLYHVYLSISSFTELEVYAPFLSLQRFQLSCPCSLYFLKLSWPSYSLLHHFWDLLYVLFEPHRRHGLEVLHRTAVSKNFCFHLFIYFLVFSSEQSQ